MAIKAWGTTDIAKGDSYLVSSYEHIEAHDNNDYVVSSDINRVLRNLYEIENQTHSFLEELANSAVQKQGVFKGSYSSAFSFDGDTDQDVVAVELGTDNFKHYARLAPGIAFFSDYIVVNRPQIHIAERILARIFNLEVDGQESITINYTYSTDKYDAVIVKKDGSGTPQTHTFNGGGSKYDSGIQLLEAIWNDVTFNSAFNNAVGDSIEDITLEPVAPVIGDTYWWQILNDGTIQLGDSVGDSTFFNLAKFEAGDTGDSISHVSNVSDERIFFQNFTDFQQNIYMNVPTTWGDTDTTDVDNADYSKVTNNDTLVTILRQQGGSEDNVVFGYYENDIPDSPVPGGKNQMLYMNRDLIVNYGVGWTQLSALAASVGSGMPVVSEYGDLPGDTADGTLTFVKELNIIYRYYSTFGWAPVTDPKRAFTQQVANKMGDQGDSGDSSVFKFSSLYWKLDGSDLQVYKDGAYLLLGDSDGYSIVDHNTINLGDTPGDAEKITALIITGGSGYYAQREKYVVGDSSGTYDGNLTNFPLQYVEVEKDKTDVYRNGILMRESEFRRNISQTTAGNEITVYTTGSSFNGTYVGNFIEATNGPNIGEVRKIATVVGGDTIEVGDSFGDSTGDTDTYQVYTDFDYYVDESSDEVYFAYDLIGDSDIEDIVEIRDRVAVIGAELETVSKGDTFPDYPNFGMEFWHNGNTKWYKYAGTVSGWIALS